MSDRHAVQALLQAGQSLRQIARQLGISRRTAQRIVLEPPVVAVDDAAAQAACGIRRPGLPEDTRATIPTDVMVRFEGVAGDSSMS